MIIRPLTIFEREGIRGFYLALSREDRRLRFCSMPSDTAVNRYVSRLDFAQTAVLGLFDARARIIGLAELVRSPGEGEMTFAVRADMRGRGLGTMLMEKALARAKMYGVRRVYVMFLSENTPMRRLALRAGMRLHRDGAETFASLNIEAPRIEDLTRWFVEDSFSHSGYFSALMVARWRSLLASPLRRTAYPTAVAA